jgi:hypothetical protein
MDEIDAPWRNDIAGYRIRETPTHYVDVIDFLFTTAVVLTPRAHPDGYVDRWCFHTLDAAEAAARAWPDPEAWTGRPGGSEPHGWHRHPDSGRRRPGGDPAKEYVAP